MWLRGDEKPSRLGKDEVPFVYRINSMTDDHGGKETTANDKQERQRLVSGNRSSFFEANGNLSLKLLGK